MSSEKTREKTKPRDITEDFLLCNRCGKCRSVCPVCQEEKREWSSARGKVELAEAFFRGEPVEPEDFREVFEMCLHCKTCTENCPSGMRADEVVMAATTEMARRGFLPRLKRIALGLLEGMDNILFKTTRAVGLAQKAPLHGVGMKSPLRHLFPLLGWSKERFVPLPQKKPFLSESSGFFRAAEINPEFPSPAALRASVGEGEEGVDLSAAFSLLERVRRAREKNLERGFTAYYFAGHAVNHFFPEEAEAVVGMLNILGVDVVVPADQICCGAPVYYAGDLGREREIAAKTVKRFQRYDYDVIVTSCASGGLMLKDVYPRLFDLTGDGYFRIEWDREAEVLRRKDNGEARAADLDEAARIYRQKVEGRVRDINEMLAELLHAGAETDQDTSEFIPSGEEESLPENGLPVVTYHHPCHLNRGQGINSQPESLLELLPGYTYRPMPEADRCCGGGGSFTFTHSSLSESIGRVKMRSVESVNPDMLVTSCPVCRIQLMDMVRRYFVLHAGDRGKEEKVIPVRTPVELLLNDTGRIMNITN